MTMAASMRLSRPASNSGDPAHASATIRDHIVDLNAVPDLRSAFRGRVDQSAVEQRATRRVQRTDADIAAQSVPSRPFRDS